MKGSGFKKSPYKKREKSQNIVQFDKRGYPSCEEHGAMNCVEKGRRLWRCIVCGVGVSFGSFDEWIKIHKMEKIG